MDLNLEEIDRLVAATTKGPWHVAREIDGVYSGRYTVVRSASRNRRVVTVSQTRQHDGERAEANTRFIAEAHALVPALVAEVRRLRAALAEGR